MAAQGPCRAASPHGERRVQTAVLGLLLPAASPWQAARSPSIHLSACRGAEKVGPPLCPWRARDRGLAGDQVTECSSAPHPTDPRGCTCCHCTSSLSCEPRAMWVCTRAVCVYECVHRPRRRGLCECAQETGVLSHCLCSLATLSVALALCPLPSGRALWGLVTYKCGLSPASGGRQRPSGQLLSWVVVPGMHATSSHRALISSRAQGSISFLFSQHIFVFDFEKNGFASQ